MRYLALKKSGAKAATAKIVTGLTKEQKREFVIKDNSNFGEYDFDALANGWSELPLADWGVDLPEDWLGGDKSEPADAEPQIDRAEELNQIWQVKPGDLWQIGEHRLLCGDSTKKEDVGRVMGGSKSDFLVTSPPYNVGVEYAIHDDTQAPWDDYKTFLEQVLDVILPTLKDGRAIAWNIGTLPKTHHVRQHLLLEERYSLTYYRQMVWKKVGVPVPLWYNTKNDPRARRFTPNYQHEVVLIFTKGKLEIGDPTGIDDLCTNDVFEFGQQFATTDIPSGNTRTGAQSNLSRSSCKAHPAAFPVRIPSMFMMHLSAPGEIVIEPFCGSGSTMVACQNLNRKCRGIEISPDYCAVILQRMTDAFPGIEIKKIK
jgi:DNA modification methylase